MTIEPTREQFAVARPHIAAAVDKRFRRVWFVLVAFGGLSLVALLACGGMAIWSGNPIRWLLTGVIPGALLVLAMFFVWSMPEQGRDMDKTIDELTWKSLRLKLAKEAR